jgi:hypothetical protein
MAASTRLVPRDLLRTTDNFEEVSTSRKVRFPEQTPLFDPGVVDVGDGSTVDLGGWDRVLYLAMLVALGFQSPYVVLKDSGRAESVVRAYEQERAAVRARAAVLVRAFVAERDIEQVVAATERLWMRACRAAGMSDSRR